MKFRKAILSQICILQYSVGRRKQAIERQIEERPTVTQTYIQANGLVGQFDGLVIDLMD